MAAPVCLSKNLKSPLSFSIVRHNCSSKLSGIQLRCSSSSSSSYGQMESPNSNGFGRRKFMEFPYVSAPIRTLMTDLVSTLESRIDSDLLPCTLPQNVQYYQNENGTAQASLQIRSGRETSPIDFILGSWLHSDLPSGGELNITSLSAYLATSTDAPHFVFELIQNSPSSLILILDLPPRKDLVLHGDYLKKFYEDTQLDKQRQLLANLPEVTPYFTSSLFMRCVFSPTVILVGVNTASEQRMDEIVQDHVSPIAKEVMRIWLDQCVIDKGDKFDEVGDLKKRDSVFKKKTIEIDLGASLPKLFGQDMANEVLAAIQEVLRRS